MNKKNLVLAAAGIFLAGLITGSVGMGAFVKYRYSPGLRIEKIGPVGFFMERLDNALDLNDAQRLAIAPIVEDVLNRLREVREPCMQAEDVILGDAAGRIAGLLDDSQKRKFEQFMEKGRRFRGKFFGPWPKLGPPPPPPGLPGAPPPPPPPPGGNG